MWRLKGVCSPSVLTEFMSCPLNTTDASEPLPLLSVKICRAATERQSADLCSSDNSLTSKNYKGVLHFIKATSHR